MSSSNVLLVASALQLMYMVRCPVHVRSYNNRYNPTFMVVRSSISWY